MTIKEASDKFNIDEKEIRKRKITSNNKRHLYREFHHIGGGCSVAVLRLGSAKLITYERRRCLEIWRNDTRRKALWKKFV